MAKVTTGTVIENSAAVCMARVRHTSGTLLAAGDVDSVTCKVFNADDPSNYTTPILLPADCFFDTLQTDARWTADATGYNFAAELSGANFPTGNVAYRVEVKVQPNDGEAFYLVWEVDCIEVLSE